MPIYEYEPKDRNCLMCKGRVEVLQDIDDDPLTLCPFCGMDVEKVVSRASIKTRSSVNPEKAAKKGFSTFKKVGKGTWEKIAGPNDGQEAPKKDGVITPSDLEQDP